MRTWLLTVLLLLTVACSRGNEGQSLGSNSEICTPAWFERVEAVVQSGDGQGHGPDIGSEEWKSVIEFRLGVREEPDVPERSSNAWCQYINQLMTGGTQRASDSFSP